MVLSPDLVSVIAVSFCGGGTLEVQYCLQLLQAEDCGCNLHTWASELAASNMHAGAISGS